MLFDITAELFVSPDSLFCYRNDMQTILSHSIQHN